MNLLPCENNNGRAVCLGYEFGLAETANDETGEYQVGVRPEFIKFDPKGLALADSVECDGRNVEHLCLA